MSGTTKAYGQFFTTLSLKSSCLPPTSAWTMRPSLDVAKPFTRPSCNYQTDALALYHALSARAKHDLPLRTSLHVLEGALRLYTCDNLAVAFNGGKDATVVLHLLRAVVAKAAHESNEKVRVHCLYLMGGAEKEFPAVEAFVREQVEACGLDGMEVDAGFKDGIRVFIGKREAVCAFVMGTRRDDPHGQNMEHFEPSSPGWPPFMRVNPILTWGYVDVWRFLRELSLPYCSLYDEGYTSIGSMATTRPNPALGIVSEADGAVQYRPAWALKDPALERAGRTTKSVSRRDSERSEVGNS